MVMTTPMKRICAWNISTEGTVGAVPEHRTRDYIMKFANQKG